MGESIKHNSYLTSERKLKFINYLNFIVTIKPLIDNGTIILLPKKIARFNSPRSIRSEIKLGNKEILNKVDFKEIDRICKKNNSSFNEIVKIGLLRAAEENLGSMAKMKHVFNGAIDFYMPYKFWHQVLNVILYKSNQLFYKKELLKEIELLRLAKLTQVHIPNIDNVSYKDIISIRQNEDAFEQWRISLGNALEKIENIQIDFINEEEVSLKILKDETFEAKKNLEKKMGKSNVLKDAKRGFKSFTIGAITTTIAYPFTGDIKFGLATSASAVLAELLFNQMKNRTESKYILNHYLSIHDPI